MNIAIFGLPGSGKTYFASQFALKIKALHISSDAVRKDLLQMGHYEEQAKSSVYQAMLQLMEDANKYQQNVVLDATFNKRHIRNLFIEKARELHHQLYFIEIKADESVIRERLRHKRPDSEADFDVYLKIKEEFEQLDEDHLMLHSDQESIDEMLNRAVVYIKNLQDETAGY
ncbi:AAA family ATPase [Pedobacter immunditicola]|uniref:AAA family ATPase n=1 Tax=Pedobacter immunditicola TaxID=3133440 RepID=UPI0030AB3F25